jgi:hypothetical protein
MSSALLSSLLRKKRVRAARKCKGICYMFKLAVSPIQVPCQSAMLTKRLKMGEYFASNSMSAPELSKHRSRNVNSKIVHECQGWRLSLAQTPTKLYA